MILIVSLGCQLVCTLIISQHNSKHGENCHSQQCLGGIATLLHIACHAESYPTIRSDKLDQLQAQRELSFQVK